MSNSCPFVRCLLFLINVTFITPSKAKLSHCSEHRLECEEKYTFPTDHSIQQ